MPCTQAEIQPGDRVRFVEPGFPVTGKEGVVKGEVLSLLSVDFDDGTFGAWARRYFEKLD